MSIKKKFSQNVTIVRIEYKKSIFKANLHLKNKYFGPHLVKDQCRNGITSRWGHFTDFLHPMVGQVEEFEEGHHVHSAKLIPDFNKFTYFDTWDNFI